MTSDLERFIATAPLVDSHEHLCFEQDWVDNGGDILVDLFANYVTADLLAAGACPRAVEALVDPADPDIAGRFTAVAGAWEAVCHTGYGEAVSIIAQTLYDLPRLTPGGLAEANQRAHTFRRPGERLRLLREVAGLDHVQVDHFSSQVELDPSGPDFFFYDISWFEFCTGGFDPVALGQRTGCAITDLTTLREALGRCFTAAAPVAIAVKSQHAYDRSLAWREHDAGDVARVLTARLAGETLPAAARDVLGDWCWAVGVELSIEHRLPFKLHTGYYAGNDRMPLEFTRPANLCRLLARYPEARFVLMHAGYPDGDDLIALAKHYRNVFADLCWTWSISPLSTVRFLREFIHTAPINKLLGFGGDTRWPTAAVGYARQARRWLARALTAEVEEGLLTERQAVDLAERIMSRNQMSLFDLAGKRAALAALGQ